MVFGVCGRPFRRHQRNGNAGTNTSNYNEIANTPYKLLGTVVLFFSVYIETLSGIEPKSFTTQARECLNYFQLTNKQSILLLFIE